MSDLFVDNIKHQSSQGSGTITIGASGETINVVGTLQNNGSAVGGTNTPAFRAYMGSAQTINDVTTTLVQYNAENFDTDNAYDTSTYRFTVPSGKAGKYFFGANIYLTDAGNSIYSANLQIRKNGINISQAEFSIDSADWYNTILQTNGIIDLAVGDYVDCYTIANTADGTSWVAYSVSPWHWGVFYGYKLIG